MADLGRYFGKAVDPPIRGRSDDERFTPACGGEATSEDVALSSSTAFCIDIRRRVIVFVSGVSSFLERNMGLESPNEVRGADGGWR